MRVLFSSTWGVGHVFPMIPLAHAFLVQGHEVLWVTNEPAAPLVRAAGVDVRVGGLDVEGLEDVRRRLLAGTAELAGRDRAAFAFPNMFGAWATPSMVPDLLAVARDWRPDLLVHEPAEHASELVGAVLGIRCVTHSWGGAIPASMLEATNEKVADVWAEHGLAVPPYAGSFSSTYLDLCPPSVQPVSIDHIPVRQPMRPMLYSGEGAAPPPYLDGDDRPLVYVTLGTVHNQMGVLAAAVDGVTRQGARVLVTIGQHGDPDALGPQPDGVHVERWVSQADVLPRASVVVSHCGSGTFLGALGFGLPQVCLPQAADQFRNAEALVAVGAGVAFGPDDVTADAIESAVARVLAEDTFRRAAATVADEMHDMPDPDEVARLLAP